MMTQQAAYAGIGRHKDSVAHVRLVPGNGQITINKGDVTKCTPYSNLVQDMKRPLALAETEGQYNVKVNVNGGGFSGQANAVRLNIACTLLETDPDFCGSLRKTGMLTRDPRMKGRKKPDLEKACKVSQFLEH